MVKPLGLKLLSQLSAAGDGGVDTKALLFSAHMNSPLVRKCVYDYCGETFVGEVAIPLAEIPEHFFSFRSRIARLAMRLIEDARQELDLILASYSPERIGVVLGSSTSVIGAAEEAFIKKKASGNFPDDYSYNQQEVGAISTFIAEYLGILGPNFTVSTACSSSAKAFSSASALIEAGFCDVVIAGGIDSLCKMTVGGFYSLELISENIANPFSKNRSGLNIGEGGALFIVSKSIDTPILLRGIGEASDAYHISTPHPDGAGAIASISAALKESGAQAKDVSYINLHGTGTLFNDVMEAKAVNNVLGENLACSSTKPITGHTLGAAGALELAFCCLALQEKSIPVHRFDNHIDPELASIALATKPARLDLKGLLLSSSFAFGGSNCCLAIGSA